MRIRSGRYQRLLLTYLQPHWLGVILLTTLVFISIGLQLWNPQIIRYFIDTAQAGRPTSLLLLAATFFIVFALLQRIIDFAATYTAENIGWDATNALRADLTYHCLQLDMSFHKQHTPGELIERIDGDVTALANFFSHLTIKVIGNSLLLCGILALLFREDWRVGLGLTIYSVLTFIVLLLLQQVSVGKWTRQREASAEHYSFLEEHISGTEDIRSLGAEWFVQDQFSQLMNRLLRTTRTARLTSNITAFSTRFLFVLGYTIGLAIGTYLYTHNQVSIGSAYLIVYYIGMLATPIEHIREQISDLQSATASIGRIEELLSIRSSLPECIQSTLTPHATAVRFEHVTFSYDQEHSVLKDISFQVPEGKTLGILGRTGSGKTTLARLLFRFYDPQQGYISLQQSDLRDLALKDLREHIGMVTQDVQLFQGSIRDNLTFFKDQISDQQIEKALAELGLLDWIQRLPQGLQTQLNAGGQGLSAGEAQLLAFVRVFLKNPTLLILDEASARLDPATETMLEHALDRLLEQRTAIIIAHRLQTVERADDILILDNGHVLEYGPRTVLAHNPHSHLYRLLQTGLEEVLA